MNVGRDFPVVAVFKSAIPRPFDQVENGLSHTRGRRDAQGPLPGKELLWRLGPSH